MRKIAWASGLLLALVLAFGCNSETRTSSSDAGTSAATDSQTSGELANWHESLDAALQAAKAENKLVFVDFSAEW